jgi:hypothetical protein
VEPEEAKALLREIRVRLELMASGSPG